MEEPYERFSIEHFLRLSFILQTAYGDGNDQRSFTRSVKEKVKEALERKHKQGANLYAIVYTMYNLLDDSKVAKAFVRDNPKAWELVVKRNRGKTHLLNRLADE